MRIEDSETFARMRGGVLYRTQDHFDFLDGPEIARFTPQRPITLLRGRRMIAPRKIEVYEFLLRINRKLFGHSALTSPS